MTERALCPFCQPDQARVAFAEDEVIGLWDAFPVSPGHLLVIPKRHFPAWFEATPQEHEALTRGIEKARQTIETRHRPDGYNIGINVGAAGGQTVNHLHVHVIPRYTGDVPNARGGVRHVIPGKGDYLGTPPAGTRDMAPRLITGGEDLPSSPTSSSSSPPPIRPTSPSVSSSPAASPAWRSTSATSWSAAREGSAS